MSQDSDFYRNQICSARAEIRNLRQLISSLKHEHQKEIAAIKNTINGLRCASCSEQATTYIPYNTPKTPAHTPKPPDDSTIIMYKPIGYIESSFLNKRAVPRQPVVVNTVVGAVVINTSLFSNPEHALMGLEEFSHMWVIFHFHNTESNAVLAKVAPPRLRGERLGVFATRAPHRPCPVGLSLVKIQKIEGNKIYFYGVDMISGTPVLDIKPYIPQYDYPTPPDSHARPTMSRSGDGRLSPSPTLQQSTESIETLTQSFDNLLTPTSPPTIESPSTSELNNYHHTPRLERGSPDGQERFTPPNPAPRHDGIKIAHWLSNPPSEIYEVRFTDEAFSRLVELIGDRAHNFRTNIEMLLKEDPRSHYVRTKYKNHEYCCVLEDCSVSCNFDSDSLICTIIAVRGADEMQA